MRGRDIGPYLRLPVAGSTSKSIGRVCRLHGIYLPPEIGAHAWRLLVRLMESRGQFPQFAGRVHARRHVSCRLCCDGSLSGDPS